MGQTVTLTAGDGHIFSAYMTGPGNAAQGLLVLPEIFGINHHIRAVADRFGDEGFHVIAPALFDRAERGLDLAYGPEDRQKGIALYGKLTTEAAIEDIRAAAIALGSKRKGVVGYCYGGGVAWLSATRTNDFAAASCWYGGMIAGTKDEKPSCPVQMHFGEADMAISMADVAAIRAAQPNLDIYTYAGAGHGFGCDERGSFNKQAYELAQQRTLTLFERNLK